jgi:hypothetical protein
LYYTNEYPWKIVRKVKSFIHSKQNFSTLIQTISRKHCAYYCYKYCNLSVRGKTSKFLWIRTVNSFFIRYNPFCVFHRGRYILFVRFSHQFWTTNFHTCSSLASFSITTVDYVRSKAGLIATFRYFFFTSFILGQFEVIFVLIVTILLK